MKEIMQWANAQDEGRIFWLNGMAGTGKSTIARTVAREWNREGRLAASFFFCRGNGDVSHAGKFFTTIARQLANMSPTLKLYICKAITSHKDIANQTLQEQWNHLIFQPLSMLQSGSLQSSLVLVVDALDECDGDNDIRLILRLLTKAEGLESKALRIFITSRPEIPIRFGFNIMPGFLHHDLALHKVSRATVDRDISIFFRDKFTEIRDDFGELPADWANDQTIRLLVERAEGLFIYAATVCRFIKGDGQWPPQDLLHLFLSDNGSSHTPEWKYDIAWSAPTRELDEIYMRSLQHSLREVGETRYKNKLTENFKQVIGSLTILYEPLSAGTLSKLLHVRQEVIDMRLRHLRSVLIVPDTGDAPIRLLHPSFRDFLHDKHRCYDESFWVDEKQAHKALVENCIQLMSVTLKRDVCGLGAPGVLITDIESSRVKQCLPLEVQYACLYWVQHLQRSGVQLHDNGQVHQFLREYLLYWLEALSCMQKISEGILAISSLESLILVGLPTAHLGEFRLTYRQGQ